LIRRWKAYPVYLTMQGALALFTGAIFTASSIYQVTVAGLSPLQLVLVGTMLELSVFVFEIPTGVVADVYSRRLSIIIGMFLIGLGFLVEGTFPIFWLILLAQVLWGVGYTFTSGATEAWITDEIGEAAAGKAFLRGSQVDQIASLAGIGLGVLLGSLRISLPIQVGGVLIALVGVLLILVMPETGFKPAASEERSSWQNMAHTFRAGIKTVRGRPVLLTILSIGLIYGLYSEGYDRLWTKQILDQFTFPLADRFQPVFWFGLIRAVGMLLSVGAAEVAQRKVQTERHLAVARASWAISAVLVASLLVFALAKTLLVAVIAVWLISMSRNVIGPLYTAWVNQRLDSRVRATVISMSSQVDAIGQVAGGPVVGLIGSWLSVQAALVASALTLSPVLLLYRRAMRLKDEPPAQDEPAIEAEV
jgi:DHA3 family tetracycline resistance protein-like MFS transporter